MARKKSNTSTEVKQEVKQEVKAYFPVELSKDGAVKKAYSAEVLELLKNEGWE